MSEVQFSDEEEKAFKNSGSETFPDGRYSGTLVEAIVRLSGEFNDKKWLCLKYELTNPIEHKGRTYTHFLTLSNSKAYIFVKEALAKFGIDTHELALRNVEDEVSKRVGAAGVTFSLTTKGQYQNASIEAVTINEDDIPF